jgi:membrane fusion protein (multidrug efflux system)
MHRGFVLSLTLLASLAAACNETTAEQTKPATATLPEDVRSVAAVAQPQQQTTTMASGMTTTDGSLGANGVLSSTGEFVSPAQSDLAPKYPGRVARIFVDEGQFVQKGQPLLELETTYTRLDIERMAAEVARAKSAAEEARRDYERKKELRAKASIPQATFDRSEAGYQQATAALASANAGLSSVRQRLADATLRSPLTGVVASRQTDVGEFLADGGVSFVVIQTAPLKLRFRVPERYLASLHHGQTVRAQVDPYPNETFEGTVSVVGQVIDPATRTFFVEAIFQNRDARLRPGLFARVETDIR